IKPRSRRNEGALGNYRLYGDRQVVTPNEPNALTVVYYLREEPAGKVTITVKTPDGKEARTLEGPKKAGMNRAFVNLGGLNRQQAEADARPRPAGAVRELAAGEYEVTLQVGNIRLTQKARVLPSPWDDRAPAKDN